MMRGKPVDPGAIYFRCTPQIEAPAGPKAWLGGAHPAPREARNEYLEVSTVLSLDYSAKVATTLRLLPGAGNLQVLAS